MERRKTSLDLLKIICIVMIISLHYFSYRIGAGFNTDNIYFAAFKFYLESLAICASNVFIIIYGYNSINKKRDIKYIVKNILKILSVVIIYSFIPALVYYYYGGANDMLGMLLSNAVNFLWFPKHFMILIALTPLLNYIVSKLDKKKYIILLLLLIFIICFICLLVFDFLFVQGGYNVQTFILLYLIGGYIKLYRDKSNIKINILLYLLFSFIIFVLYGFDIKWAYYYNNIFVILESIVFFNIFNNINMKKNKIITEISTYSLAIYIIHTSIFIKTVLYKDIFRTYIYCKDINFLWNFPLTIVGIFIICFVIEYIRRLIIKLIKKGITK